MAQKKTAKRTAKKAVKKAVRKVARKTAKKAVKVSARAAVKKVVKMADRKIVRIAEKKVDAKKRRLSKKELEHYRQTLLAERSRILHELGRITEAINESAEEQEAAKQSYSNHLADLGTDYMEKEKNYYYADQEGQFLKAIEAALERIERGEYGLCIECGELISEKRLEAVPSAELCIACKDKKEKIERSR
ncbi:MAG: TraR/DksA C4-type zinc finger protein [Candidatus Krumholzibacteria bacterium]|nr:TraR/DksA C4-type zinc finger protein [Candidatus Krumholzibacteria bacterium]